MYEQNIKVYAIKNVVADDAEIENKDTFIKTIFYLEENNIPLIGGVNKYYSPITKKDYLFFPIKKID